MRFDLISLFSDNYAHLLIDEQRSEAVVVDPSEAGPVLAYLDREGLTVSAVWNTHHHFDHTGGNEALHERYGCRVLAGAHDSVPAQTEALKDGDCFTWSGAEVKVMHTPGHTLDALSYLTSGRAYTGDTLFLGGCGRLFEGTPEQMWTSLCRLRDLPGDTLVCCGHEYTESNLRFASHVAPDDDAVAQRLEQVCDTISRGEPTVPAPISVERRTNPFLRADDPALLESLARFHGAHPVPGPEAFAVLRGMKDAF